MGTGTPKIRPFVLLTGATGLVGGLVLALLLKSNIPVAVLVRSNRRQTARERVNSLMERLEERFRRTFTRPVVLTADLCSPGLGLSETDLRWLTRNCGSVIHSAANLLFRPASTHPDNEPYRTNVDGTKCLLDVMNLAGITEWHYVSTAYISGLRTGRILETESDAGQQFGNDYERSKAVAEQMLMNATGIRSLTIYRPSIVIDLHPTTSMRSDQTINSAFAMFKALSQRFGLPERGDWFRRLGFNGHERKNIVTVDWVSSMIVRIYRRPALHQQTYHLTSPTGCSASELEDGFRAAVLRSGIKLPAIRPNATAMIDEQAAPFVAAFSPYFKDDPVFDRSNTIRAMAVCEESDLPELTVDHLRDFCLHQTKATLPVSPDNSEQTLWCKFLQCSAAGTSPELHPMNRHLAIGLELSGPGGGQWLIDDSSGSLVASLSAAELAPNRIIMTTRTFRQLLDAQLSLAKALDSGRVLLEFGETDSVSTPETRSAASAVLTDRLARLLSEIQRRHFHECGLRSEVANVG